MRRQNEKKSKKIVNIIMVFVVIYAILNTIYYIKPNNDEIEARRFAENQARFDEMVFYYQNLDYGSGLRNVDDGEIVIIDNMKYRLYHEQEFYNLVLVGDYYEKFNTMFFGSEQDIEQVIGNFQGVSIDISKENMQVTRITINISDYNTGYHSLLCWYNQVDINQVSADCTIALNNNWYILRWGYT